ncbi:MAG: hypothetical protein ABWY57_01480 [Mycetocola sp.]
MTWSMDADRPGGRTTVLAAIVLAVLLGTSACTVPSTAAPGVDGDASSGPAISAEDLALITVELEPGERQFCSNPDIAERIEAAKASTNETGILVTPQDVFEASGEWSNAVAQKERWDDLTPMDRLFNLCMLEPWRS